MKLIIAILIFLEIQTRKKLEQMYYDKLSKYPDEEIKYLERRLKELKREKERLSQKKTGKKVQRRKKLTHD